MVLVHLTAHLKENKFIHSAYIIGKNKSQCAQDEVIQCVKSTWGWLFKEKGNPNHEEIG